MSKLALGRARIDAQDPTGRHTEWTQKGSLIVELDTCRAASAMKYSSDMRQISLLLWASSLKQAIGQSDLKVPSSSNVPQLCLHKKAVIKNSFV